MSDKLIEQLRKEAARNAQMQGDKEHQTNRRRKTFRGRNRLFTKAADRIDELDRNLELAQHEIKRLNKCIKELKQGHD